MLRACAIALVFVYHYRIFVSAEPDFGWVAKAGWVGVDLFFVLSGYLIGNQLLGGFPKGQPLGLGVFYARRVFRTWPAFWVMLAVYMVADGALGGRPPPPWIRFITFTQNIGLTPGTTFSHAWSLCVEEQFYLVIPLLVLIWARLGRRPVLAWALLAMGVVFGMSLRGWLWTRYGREADGHIAGYYPNIYYSTLCRMDEFLPGIAVALLRHAHPAAWQRLKRRQRLLTVIAVPAILALLYGAATQHRIDGYGYGWFMTTFGYSLLAVGFALVVLVVMLREKPSAGWRVPGIKAIACWSYSIYLTHKAVAHVLHQRLPGFGISPVLELICITAACILVGAALYRAVELPFMKLREHWFPDRSVSRDLPT